MTGKGRESLCKVIRQVEDLYPGSVLRTHTDSIVLRSGVEISKIKGFVIGKGIGEWKVEDQGKCKILNGMDCKFNDKIK